MSNCSYPPPESGSGTPGENSPPAVLLLPDALATALEEAGFPDVAFVTVIEPGKEPRTLIAPDKANIVEERFEIPVDQVRIGNESLRGSRFLSYIFEGSTTQANCEWKEEGGRWVCVKVRSR